MRVSAKLRVLLFLVMCLAAADRLQAQIAVTEPLYSNEGRSFVLDCCINCRDLGGLPARGGYIKKGLIFRTPQLAKASDADVKKLEKLGLRTVIDLRTEKEIKQHGKDRLPLATKKKWFWSTPVCRNVHLPMDVYSQPSPDDVHCYLAFLFENPQSIASFFNILSDPESYPLSYHCYAGKDRTGIMTALLLELLGTPRPVIYSDFLYSRCRDMEVCSPDLDRIFAAIDYKYGGIEPFLTGLGVSAEKLHKIPEIVVEPAPQKP